MFTVRKAIRRTALKIGSKAFDFIVCSESQNILSVTLTYEESLYRWWHKFFKNDRSKSPEYYKFLLRILSYKVDRVEVDFEHDCVYLFSRRGGILK